MSGGRWQARTVGCMWQVACGSLTADSTKSKQCRLNSYYSPFPLATPRLASGVECLKLVANHNDSSQHATCNAQRATRETCSLIQAWPVGQAADKVAGVEGLCHSSLCPLRPTTPPAVLIDVYRCLSAYTKFR